jgi:hypothetical protein
MLFKNVLSKKPLKKLKEKKIWPSGKWRRVLSICLTELEGTWASSFMQGELLPSAVFTQETVGMKNLGVSQGGEYQ